jgi:co-chaperonin GroES (HSP10)
MKALLSKVIVKPVKEDSLLISTTTKASRKGVVISIGGSSLLKHDLEIGETVIFGAFSGVEFESEGEKYIVLNENEVLTPIP